MGAFVGDGEGGVVAFDFGLEVAGGVDGHYFVAGFLGGLKGGGEEGVEVYVHGSNIGDWAIPNVKHGRGNAKNAEKYNAEGPRFFLRPSACLFSAPSAFKPSKFAHTSPNLVFHSISALFDDNNYAYIRLLSCGELLNHTIFARVRESLSD